MSMLFSYVGVFFFLAGNSLFDFGHRVRTSFEKSTRFNGCAVLHSEGAAAFRSREGTAVKVRIAKNMGWFSAG